MQAPPPTVPGRSRKTEMQVCTSFRAQALQKFSPHWLRRFTTCSPCLMQKMFQALTLGLAVLHVQAQVSPAIWHRREAVRLRGGVLLERAARISCVTGCSESQIASQCYSCLLGAKSCSACGSAEMAVLSPPAVDRVFTPCAFEIFLTCVAFYGAACESQNGRMSPSLKSSNRLQASYGDRYELCTLLLCMLSQIKP